MENSATSMDTLVERIEKYGKTTIELYQCHTAYESAALFSYLAVKAVMILIVSVVALLFTIAVALWIGDVLEKTAYGFLIMGMFYIVIGSVVYIFRKPLIKNKVSNHTIRSFKLPKN